MTNVLDVSQSFILNNILICKHLKQSNLKGSSGMKVKDLMSILGLQAGIFGQEVALGRQHNNPIDFRRAKAHFRFKSLF